MSTKISIIIPVYNTYKFITRCLESVVSQSFQDYEIILIDDCGSDDSIIMAESYLSLFPSIKYRIIHQSSNLGLSEARNRGIRESEGDYLFFIDSDDTITDDCLKELYKCAVYYDAEFVTGNNTIIHPDKEVLIETKIQKNIITNNKEILQYYLDSAWYNVAWNKLIKRDTIVKNKLYFPKGYVHEDEYWSFKLALCAKRMGIVHKSLYNYYINENSIMRQNPVCRLLQYIDVLSLMRDEIYNYSQDKNPNVCHFFIQKLVSQVIQLSKLKVLNNEIYAKIQSIVFFDLYYLYKNKTISIKELIAYYHFNLPSQISFLYFRLISIFLSTNEK